MKRNLLIHQFRNQDGKKYRVYLSKNPARGGTGDCDPPSVSRPIIRVRDYLMRQKHARRQLSIFLEEMLHAHDFNLTEKCVRKYAANTTKLLYKLGWRWKPEEGLDLSKFRDKETTHKMFGWKNDS